MEAFQLQTIGGHVLYATVGDLLAPGHIEVFEVGTALAAKR